jgi:hypothetical protein
MYQSQRRQRRFWAGLTLLELLVVIRAGGSFPKQPPERVPPRYNTHSELSVEVTPDRTGYDFYLRT